MKLREFVARLEQLRDEMLEPGEDVEISTEPISYKRPVDSLQLVATMPGKVRLG